MGVTAFRCGRNGRLPHVTQRASAACRVTASLNLMPGAASPRQYGAVSAAWNVAYDLGWGVGSAVVGLMVTTAGFPVAFAATAALVGCVLPAASGVGRRPVTTTA